MATRIMYDSVNWQAIPSGAALVAGYVNGDKSQWPAQAWARFPGAQTVGIDVLGTAARLASVLDVEKGDVPPTATDVITSWVRARDQVEPGTATIYVQRSNWDTVRSACGKAGLSPHWWVADWTRQPHQLAGAGIVQYASPSEGSEGDYDMSAVYDDTWHAAPTWIDQAVSLVTAISQTAGELLPLLREHK